MSSSTMKGAVAAACLIGIAAAILATYALPRYAMPGGIYSLRNAALICAVIYLICGVVMGFAWRGGGWKYGLWIAAPFWLLGLLGLLFAGYLNKFLTNDVPILVTSVVAASLGAYIGGYLGSRVRKADRLEPQK